MIKKIKMLIKKTKKMLTQSMKKATELGAAELTNEERGAYILLYNPLYYITPYITLSPLRKFEIAKENMQPANTPNSLGFGTLELNFSVINSKFSNEILKLKIFFAPPSIILDAHLGSQFP
jgi:hypothetical protein